MNDRIRVIVFGIGFGQFYLGGILKLNKKFKLVGIFSKGSELSKKYAKLNNVPLYTDINKINKNIADMACVVIKSTVVGGEGTNIAKKLLKKGIHVLQEQPIHLEDYLDCIKLAKKYNCKYQLNTFYPNLKPISGFINIAKNIAKKCKIVYINAECSIHVLFPMIDILGKALNGLYPWKFKLLRKANKNIPFCIVDGSINNIPICMNIQNQIEPYNSENYMYLLHRISITTNCGNLILTGSNGMVIWEPCISRHKNKYDLSYNEKMDKFLDLPIYEIYDFFPPVLYRKLYDEIWEESIKISLETFYTELKNKKYINEATQLIIDVCRVWKTLGLEVGKSILIDGYIKKPLKLSDIINGKMQ